jgi:translation initiation factor IF-2
MNDLRLMIDGYDCGIGLEHFNDIKVGDNLEAFIMEEYKEA